MTPKLELRLFGMRRKHVLSQSSVTGMKRALGNVPKALGNLSVSIVGVIRSGGRMEQTWQLDHVDSGEVELELTFHRSEAVMRAGAYTRSR